ncbi:hypothetical protein L9F63_017011, partial [Diploptera punctata]
MPFHHRMEECFADMQKHVETKYGKKTSDLKVDNSHFVTMRRQFMSMTSSEGSRSRVSSLTRSQVASIKSFATTFNFSNINASNTLGRSQSMFFASHRDLLRCKGMSKRDKSNKDKRRSSHKLAPLFLNSWKSYLPADSRQNLNVNVVLRLNGADTH